jgi:hypothetical protein
MTMTIDEARGNIKRAVLWRPPGGGTDSTEEGVITSVTDRRVYVRFNSETSHAVDPGRLTLLAGKVPGHA